MQPYRRNTDKSKGISRIDSTRATGWFVRIYRRGETHAKFFSDGKHGGRAQALELATQYKTAYERQHPPEFPYDYLHPPFRSRPQRNNKTGVNGVSETYHRTRAGQRLRCFSVCYSPEPGVRANKIFNHDDYDSRQAALEAAKEFRLNWERQVLREYKRRVRELQYQTEQG